MSTSHECAVCLKVPEGEVHQCNEGHGYCVDCWRRINPRRCPECRLCRCRKSTGIKGCFRLRAAVKLKV